MELKMQCLSLGQLYPVNFHPQTASPRKTIFTSKSNPWKDPGQGPCMELSGGVVWNSCPG